MAFTEALLSAFALVSWPAPSLLAFAKARAAGHGPTLDGMARGPCDTHRRALLAPVSPTWVRPGCKRVLRHLQRGTAREPMGLLAGPS